MKRLENFSRWKYRILFTLKANFIKLGNPSSCEMDIKKNQIVPKNKYIIFGLIR